MRAMSADGGEEEVGSCLQDDDDLPTAPSEQHQLRAHIKRQPRPPREESKGVWRSRSDGGGSHPDLDYAPLHSSDTKGIGLIRHN